MGTTLEWARAVSSPAGRVAPVPVPAEHPLWVLFTSGTTGPPKGIVHSHAGVAVHGRSDATLNRHGIRMGSVDICQAAQDLPEVGEALVVGIEEPDGGYWMPMFVTLTDGRHLDEDLATMIRAAVRDRVSPRHAPDEVIQAPGIPYTRTGEKLEVPVKNILRGFTSAVQKDAVDRPELLEFYRETGARRRQMQGHENEGTSL